MNLSRRMLARRTYAELDYARHFPKAFIDRVTRRVPTKIYDNRFGAPPITRWAIHPDDWKLRTKRPWEGEEVGDIVKLENIYRQHQLSSKFFRKTSNKMPLIPPERWSIFTGDLVQVMVGKHKGKKSTVSHVIKEANAVFVEGMHTKLTDKFQAAQMKKLGVGGGFEYWDEQPLFVDKGEVQLVDPNDGDCCKVKWVLNDSKTQYERVSTRTGIRIPLPKRAFTTYEYVDIEKYIEVEGKDTPADVVLKRTYVPKLSTFEQEIEEEMGLDRRSDMERPPTYWY